MSYFEPTTIKRNNQLLRAVKLRCAYCTFEDRVKMNTQAHSSDDIELAQAKRKFEAQGWAFVKKPKCPQCIAEDEREAKAEEEEAAMKAEEKRARAKLKVVGASQPPQEPPASGVALPSSGNISEYQPAKQMGRDDRRIIFEKLNETYANEQVGYNVGWSDARVAKELGCPQDWIQTVRTEMFGDIAANAETMAELKAAQAMLEEGRNLVHDLEARLSRMEAVLRDIEKAVK